MELETALRQGMLPGELEEAAIMKFMGWGWRDLCEAPAQLVEDICSWMAKEGALDAERAAVARAKARGAHRQRG